MLFLLLTLLVSSLSAGEYRLEPVTEETREDYLRKAHVWKPTNIAQMDIMAGPQKAMKFNSGQNLTCDYIEPKGVGGKAPKFLCRLPSGEVVRVKYGLENKEVFAEVAATRLFWALGFYADEMYPANITCIHCPQVNPAAPSKNEKRIKRLFPDATIEPDFPGITLEEHDDQGWQWQELQKIQPDAGGAPRSHIDALNLLAVFVQHGDSKPDNQRLACFQESLIDSDGDGQFECGKPVMMVQDLGSTFGSGIDVLHVSKMNFRDWQQQQIWDTAEEAKLRAKTGKPACIGKLTASRLATETGLTNPIISEAGRVMLSDLLQQLSDQQITDLFRVARVERLDDMIEENGVERNVTLEDWVQLFKKKRAEIANAVCE